MKRWILLLLVLHTFFNGNSDFLAKNPDNYGPYVVDWDHYDKCRGPKLVNLTQYTTHLIRDENNLYKGTLNVTFTEPTRIEEIKMSVFSLKDNTKTILWNYIVNKPCQHYIMAALFESQLGVKNCVVKKGDYVMDLNLSELMMNYLGKSFFYGNYLFKVTVLSKKGNIVCLIFDPKFKKKPKS